MAAAEAQLDKEKDKDDDGKGKAKDKGAAARFAAAEEEGGSRGRGRGSRRGRTSGGEGAMEPAAAVSEAGIPGAGGGGGGRSLREVLGSMADVMLTPHAKGPPQGRGGAAPPPGVSASVATRMMEPAQLLGGRTGGGARLADIDAAGGAAAVKAALATMPAGAVPQPNAIPGMSGRPPASASAVRSDSIPLNLVAGKVP